MNTSALYWARENYELCNCSIGRRKREKIVKLHRYVHCAILLTVKCVDFEG